MTISPARLADCSPAAMLEFDGCVGEPLSLPRGEADACLALVQLGYAAEMVGAMELLYGQTVDYARQRKQFGVAIGTFQAVQHKLARMFVSLEQTRSTLLKAGVAAREAPGFVRGVLGAKGLYRRRSAALRGGSRPAARRDGRDRRAGGRPGAQAGSRARPAVRLGRGCQGEAGGMTRNRRWTLARRPAGAVAAGDFALVEDALAERALAAGEVLVRNRMFAVAPTIRNWLNDPGQSYRGSIPIGGTIGGMAACEVVASADPTYSPGARLVAMSRWEDWSVLRPAEASVPVFPVPDGMPFEDALGAYSPNSLTAYFGLTDVGRPVAGETVLVSGAAGSVGSLVCQIARILGCRVIGIAGGQDKCRWLESACGVDAAIDYRAGDVAARLAELAPGGVDLFFDNVGGAMLQAAVDNMARHGRIVLCGQISAYDREGGAPGPRDMMKLVYGSIRMEGFVVGDYVDRAEEARTALAGWIAEGKLTVRVDLRHGFEQLPHAFTDLFRGANEGTLLVTAD